MAFNADDAVYACFRASGRVADDETTNTLRIYRDVINTAGEWKTGDTIKVKDATYKLFGAKDAKLATVAKVFAADGSSIACSTSGQGSGELTVTLTEDGPAGGGDCKVEYRVGVPATYTEMLEDRANDDFDLHKVALSGGPHTHADVFKTSGSPFRADATLKTESRIDGMSIQTNPPA